MSVDPSNFIPFILWEGILSALSAFPAFKQILLPATPVAELVETVSI